MSQSEVSFLGGCHLPGVQNSFCWVCTKRFGRELFAFLEQHFVSDDLYGKGHRNRLYVPRSMEIVCFLPILNVTLQVALSVFPAASTEELPLASLVQHYTGSVFPLSAFSCLVMIWTCLWCSFSFSFAWQANQQLLLFPETGPIKSVFQPF